jgi:hypothetical protein
MRFTRRWPVRGCFGMNAAMISAFSVTVLAVARLTQLASERLSLCR